MSSPYTGGPAQENSTGRVSGVRSSILPLPLTPVDPEMLRSRLVSRGPSIPQRHPDALEFTPHTLTQHRQQSAPKPMGQELLVRPSVHFCSYLCIHSGRLLLHWRLGMCVWVILLWVLFSIPAGSQAAPDPKPVREHRGRET